MDVDIWMPFYIGAYLKNTSRLSTLQHGGYCLLIFDYWVQGPPPNDDEVLASITKLPVPDWIRKHRPVIQPFFEIREGHWHHERIDLELALARSRAAAATVRASAGGQATKAKRNSKNAPSSAASTTSSTTSSTPQESLGAFPSLCLESAPSPLPTSPSLRSGEGRSRRKPQKTSLPPDFKASGRVREWAKAKGHFALLDQHLESFISKCRAKGYEYADWDEAFMEAIRKDWAELRSGRGKVVALAKPWRAGGEPNEVLERAARELQIEPWDKDGGETYGQFRARIVDAGGEHLLKWRGAA